MKITLSYLPGEEREADADMMVLHRRHPGSKARRSKAHLPAVSVYMRIVPGDFRKLTPCDFCGHRDERKPCVNCPAMV